MKIKSLLIVILSLLGSGLLTAEVVGQNPEIGKTFIPQLKKVRFTNEKGISGYAYLRRQEKIVIISYSSGQVRGKGEVIGFDGVGKAFSNNTLNVEGFTKLEAYLRSGWVVKEIVPVESASPESVVTFVVLESHRVVYVEFDKVEK